MIKLGKHPKKEDKRNLKLARYMAEGPIVLPLGIDWSYGEDFPMYANDRVGDCTCAQAGHAILSWTHNSIKQDDITDGQIVAAYSIVTGYNPSDPSSDQGAALLDVLKFWRSDGIGGHRITSFAAIDPYNTQELKAAVAWFGGATIGLNIPQSALDQFQQNANWDTVSGSIVGGHAIRVLGYNNYGPWFVTWSRRMQMTWEFYMGQCDEAYAVLSDNWLETSGIAPNALDFAELDADLQKVTTL